MKTMISKKSAFLFSIALLCVPFIYNSCQGGFLPLESGFSAANLCPSSKAEPASLGALNKGTAGSSEANRHLSPFSQSKVQVGADSGSELSSFSKTTHQQTISAGTELVAVVDSECLRQRSDDASEFLSDQISQGKVLLPELSQQNFAFTVDRDISLDELKSAANEDECLVGVSHQAKYRVASFNDPMAYYQAHLPAIDAEAAYEEIFNSSTPLKKEGDPLVKIAVIDTGVDWEHPDLKSVMWTHENGIGLDATTLGTGLVDYNPFDVSSEGHGTHVAGLLAAETNNGKGAVGALAHRAQIMAIKVFELENDGSLSARTNTVADAINWAVANGADVINISLGRYVGKKFGREFEQDDKIYRNALVNALNSGVFVVAAAGNGSQENPAQEMDTENFVVLPARYGPEYNGMMTVGSIDAVSGQKSFFSHWSNKIVEISAPGAESGRTGLYSTIPRLLGNRFGYGRVAGTSMAAPQVSAAAGLIIARYKEALGIRPTPDVVEYILQNAAVKSDDLAPYFKDGNRLSLHKLAKYLHKDFPKNMEYALGASESFSSELGCD